MSKITSYWSNLSEPGRIGTVFLIPSFIVFTYLCFYSVYEEITDAYGILTGVVNLLFFFPPLLIATICAYVFYKTSLKENKLNLILSVVALVISMAMGALSFLLIMEWLFL